SWSSSLFRRAGSSRARPSGYEREGQKLYLVCLRRARACRASNRAPSWDASGPFPFQFFQSFTQGVTAILSAKFLIVPKLHQNAAEQNLPTSKPLRFGRGVEI